MDTTSYHAVKLKLEQEKMQIEKEIAVLQQKKNEKIKHRERELKKLTKTQEIFSKNKVVTASMLRVDFNPEVIKVADKEILLINQYIQEQNLEIEKINEREKFINKVYGEAQVASMLNQQRKEESTIHEFKKWLGS